MAYIRKIASGWRAEIQRRGIRVSRVCRTRQAAEAWARQVEIEIDAGRYRPAAGKTVADLLERYAREVSSKKRGARWEAIRLRILLRDPLAQVPLERLAAPDIAAWRDRRLREVSAATVRREWTLLRHAFRIAQEEWHWIAEHPMRTVKPPPKQPARQRRISDEEVERILWAAGWQPDRPPETVTERVAAAFVFALETAMRAGEIVGLTWDRVHGSHVHLPRTKNGNPRDVPLSSRARAILDHLRGCEFEGGKVFGLKSSQLDALFRRLKARAGITDLHFHDTRREALTRLARRFGPLELARISGHRDLRILLDVYYAPSVEELAARLD